MYIVKVHLCVGKRKKWQNLLLSQLVALYHLIAWVSFVGMLSLCCFLIRDRCWQSPCIYPSYLFSAPVMHYEKLRSFCPVTVWCILKLVKNTIWLTLISRTGRHAWTIDSFLIRYLGQKLPRIPKYSIITLIPGHTNCKTDSSILALLRAGSVFVSTYEFLPLRTVGELTLLPSNDMFFPL